MAKLKIIGTSHIAKQSINEVEKYISEHKPEIVAIELDKQRFDTLFKERRQPKFSDIRKLGFVGYLFAKIGGSLQSKLGGEVGIIPGEDMRSAVRAAKKSKAKIALIDQPIHLTLHKLSTEMKFYDKWKLFWFLVGAMWFPKAMSGKGEKIDLTKVPPEKLIDKVITELKKKLPSLYKVLIEDRNKYMAKAIVNLVKQYPDASILAVVGAGHEKDIIQYLKSMSKK